MSKIFTINNYEVIGNCFGFFNLFMGNVTAEHFET